VNKEMNLKEKLLKFIKRLKPEKKEGLKIKKNEIPLEPPKPDSTPDPRPSPQPL
jgi:hypothetical protein